ncbi:DUF2894 domain-containing protein [Burkholderia glumae]|uniref:DUF2894 domain-containing protein n=1 Tax=Burkholderia glumae TaxID=337 RepID=UPI003F568FA7
MLDYFREAWSRLSADQQVQRSLDRVPKNAGPLNSSSLVHRALLLMRELSPEYLRQFSSMPTRCRGSRTCMARRPRRTGKRRAPRPARRSRPAARRCAAARRGRAAVAASGGHARMPPRPARPTPPPQSRRTAAAARPRTIVLNGVAAAAHRRPAGNC